MDVPSGELKQITDAEEGDNLTFCIARKRNLIIYKSGNKIYSLDLDTLKEQLIIQDIDVKSLSIDAQEENVLLWGNTKQIYHEYKNTEDSYWAHPDESTFRMYYLRFIPEILIGIYRSVNSGLYIFMDLNN